MSGRSLTAVVLAALMCAAVAQEPTDPAEPVAHRIDAKIKEALVDQEFSNDDAIAVTVYIFELFHGPRRPGHPFHAYVSSSDGKSIEVDAFYDGLKVSGYSVTFFVGPDRKHASVTSIKRISGDG